jgi:hypothetical protein
MSWLFRRGSPGAVMNMRKNAATKGLSSALTKLANSIRRIRINNPLNGTNRNNLMKLTAAGRNNVNRAIQNYIMAVNKASYKNMIAQNAVIRAQNGRIPEGAAVPPVIGAVRANSKVAEALTNITNVIVNNGISVKYGKNTNGKWQFAPNTPNIIRTTWVINNNGTLVKAKPPPLPPRPANQLQLAIRPENQRQLANLENKSVKILRAYLANHSKSNNGAKVQINLLTKYKAAANGKMNNKLRANVNARLEYLQSVQAKQNSQVQR